MQRSLLPSPPRLSLLRALAEFRYQLRRFTLFSENAAQDIGLQPQQHQLLLQIAAAPDSAAVTIAYVAERLGLRHNSAVELTDRSVAEGLVERQRDLQDSRCVIVALTAKGWGTLQLLSDSHARELSEMAPRLTDALQAVRKFEKGVRSRSAL